MILFRKNSGFRTVLATAVGALVLLAGSCGSKPTDMRSLVPAETLVYLETDDLGKALGAIVDSRSFGEAAKARPDFSALAGMQTAVAVTGFEAEENKVTAENSVLAFKPRFVAVADAHTWNSYARKFADERLGEFVNEAYGGEVDEESEEKAGEVSYVWTAKDGRKAFGHVSGSRIYFSNDQSALDKALAVGRGDGSDSLAKNESVAKARANAANALGFGYVSPDGVAQIANFAGVSTAVEATEDESGRGFIAQLLPQVLRGNVKEVFWTATKTDAGIEDRYDVALVPDAANVFKETLVPGGASETASAELLPADAVSATRYDLKNSQIAWRSLLLVAGRSADPASARILMAFAGSVLDPYSVADAEKFLGAVGGEIWTASFDAEGDKTAAVVVANDAAAVKASLDGFDFKKPGERSGEAEVWKNSDGDASAAFVGNRVIVGDPESVAKCLQAKASGGSLAKSAWWKKFAETRAPAVTFGRDQTEKVVALLGEKKNENLQMLSPFTTQTDFTSTGITRRTVSSFGLIGRILEQFED